MAGGDAQPFLAEFGLALDSHPGSRELCQPAEHSLQSCSLFPSFAARMDSSLPSKPVTLWIDV